MIRFHMDHEALSRRYPVAFSPTTCRELGVSYNEWAQQLQAIDYKSLDVAGRVGFHLLKTRMGRGRLKLVHLRETYGGETIGTSYACNAQTHEQKLSSMRSNNVSFLRATVHHELIPGHHLMMYMNDRYNTHRKGYGTPFLGEGWPLYWELLLYKLGFARTPEDRLGFLFWRAHRCARVMVVLGFHIGRLSIRDCLNLVIARVGHEEVAGTAQVRWLIAGDLALYGASYMLGGLQLMGLRRELVDSGKMGEREFHDRILQANLMPIYLLRALLTGHLLHNDEDVDWPFFTKT